MQAAKPCQTPLAVSTKLSAFGKPSTPKEKQATEQIPHRQACGSLQHLQVSTRPDISKATSNASYAI